MTARKPEKRIREEGWRLVHRRLCPWVRSWTVMPPDGSAPPVFRGTSGQCLAYVSARRPGGSHEAGVARALAHEPWVRCAHIPPARPAAAPSPTEDPVARDPHCRELVAAGTDDYCAACAPLHPDRFWPVANPDGVSEHPPTQDRRTA